MSSSFSSISTQYRDSGVLTITLDREARLNALSEGMARDIIEVCEALRSDNEYKVRAVILTGRGRAFCTGRDLKESHSHTPEDARRYMGLAIDAAHAFSSLPMPTIAAINGPCFGWGLEASLACDMRLAAEEASLCFPETRLGIFPGAGGTSRLAKLVAMDVAKELIFTARVFDGIEASELGVVTKAVPGEELLTTAVALAESIAKNAPLGLRGAKRVLEGSADLTLEAALALSCKERLPLNGTADFAEGVAAFAEKRVPVFRGT